MLAKFTGYFQYKYESTKRLSKHNGKEIFDKKRQIFRQRDFQTIFQPDLILDSGSWTWTDRGRTADRPDSGEKGTKVLKSDGTIGDGTIGDVIDVIIWLNVISRLTVYDWLHPVIART